MSSLRSLYSSMAIRMSMRTTAIGSCVAHRDEDQAIKRQLEQCKTHRPIKSMDKYVQQLVPLMSRYKRPPGSEPYIFFLSLVVALEFVRNSTLSLAIVTRLLKVKSLIKGHTSLLPTLKEIIGGSFSLTEYKMSSTRNRDCYQINVGRWLGFFESARIYLRDRCSEDCETSSWVASADLKNGSCAHA